MIIRSTKNKSYLKSKKNLKSKYFYKYTVIKKHIFFNFLTNIDVKPKLIIQIQPVLNNLYLSYHFSYKSTTKILKHFNIHTMDFFKNKSLILNFFLLELLKITKYTIDLLPKFKYNLFIEFIQCTLNKPLITLLLYYFKNIQNLFFKLNLSLPHNGCRLKKLRRKKVVVYHL